jgi:hypothetical protein
VPPFVGVAVNVTLVPAQIVVALGDTDTEGTTVGLTVITVVAVATVGLGQVALEVISTAMPSILAKVAEV